MFCWSKDKCLGDEVSTITLGKERGLLMFSLRNEWGFTLSISSSICYGYISHVTVLGFHVRDYMGRFSFSRALNSGQL